MPNGLPTASTMSPTRIAFESPIGTTGRLRPSILITARSLGGSGADQLRFHHAPVRQLDLDLCGILDHVMIGQDVAVSGDDHA